MELNLINTLKGSLLEDFFPKGWNLARIDEICSLTPAEIVKREPWWNKKFTPVPCETLQDFDTLMGIEIALEIARAKSEGRKIVFILPVGPMGMYRWSVELLKAWNISCDHVYGFNMDEWSDGAGNTLPPDNPGAFQNAMLEAFYGPLGNLTAPENQRNFATKNNLPTYGEKIFSLTEKGARLVTVFGIGRVFHIAFWEPHFAAEFRNEEEWRKPTHRLGAKLHPLTIEQNAITSFKSRTTLVPAFANTVGPGLFLKSDYVIGGCDGTLGRGMMWQGMSFAVTLHHEPNIWMPSTFMPTMAGKLFYLKDLEGPLVPECN